MNDIEKSWTAELGVDVEIVERGWGTTRPDYALYIDGVFQIAKEELSDLEDYLCRYFLLEETP